MNEEMRYPLSGVFSTIQGEGALMGLPMTFIRLGGCSIGCPECDTNYSVTGRATASEILAMVRVLPKTPYTFVTGGEPADHDITELIGKLRMRGKVALVTSGMKDNRGSSVGWRVDSRQRGTFAVLIAVGVAAFVWFWGR